MLSARVEVGRRELGCGLRKTSIAFGVDIIAGSEADLAHDPSVFLYPLEGETWDPVICCDVIEHVEDFGRPIEEMDLRALVHTAAEHSEPADMLAAAVKVNARQHHILAAKISTFFDGKLDGRAIALWGLAFKANTDDIREAPSISVINALTVGIGRGA